MAMRLDIECRDRTYLSGFAKQPADSGGDLLPAQSPGHAVTSRGCSVNRGSVPSGGQLLRRGEPPPRGQAEDC
jgi:hypothetical protein